MWLEHPNYFQISSGQSSCLKKLARVLLPPTNRTQPGTWIPGISPPCWAMKNGCSGQIQSAWWKSSAKFSSFRSCLAEMPRTNIKICATVQKVKTKRQHFNAYVAFIQQGHLRMSELMLSGNFPLSLGVQN